MNEASMFYKCKKLQLLILSAFKSQTQLNDVVTIFRTYIYFLAHLVSVLCEKLASINSERFISHLQNEKRLSYLNIVTTKSHEYVHEHRTLRNELKD